MRLLFYAHAVALVAVVTAASAEPSSSRNVLGLSEWAQAQGIHMHPSLQFKEYGNNDWGLVLDYPVDAGTLLLRVPRRLCLVADVLRHEWEQQWGAAALDRAREALGSMENHEANFWIVLKLFQLSACRRQEEEEAEPTTKADGDNNHDTSLWKPWLDAIPRTFLQFSKAEQASLPYYAKYAAEYQEKKYEAFCRAARSLNLLSSSASHANGGDDDDDILLQRFEWAFWAVGSRFWQTTPLPGSSTKSTSELVPIGDMFNHRDPPNVLVQSRLDGNSGDNSDNDGSVEFIYTGTGDDATNDKDNDDDDLDLFISYGQPSNPHRFLVIFGFAPTAATMPTVWSHLTYPDNPFSANVDGMVFPSAASSSDSDETMVIPKLIWDAVLYALLEDPSAPGATPTTTKLPVYSAARHNKPHIRKYTRQVLEQHVNKQLEELAACRTRIPDQSRNAALIRQHNAFLTNSFERLQSHLKATSGQATIHAGKE